MSVVQCELYTNNCIDIHIFVYYICVEICMCACVCSECSSCQKSACEMQISIWGHFTYFNCIYMYIYSGMCVCVSSLVLSLWSLEQNPRAGGVHTWADRQTRINYMHIYICKHTHARIRNIAMQTNAHTHMCTFKSDNNNNMHSRVWQIVRV